MEEKGVIVENNKDHLLVRIERHSACSSCDKNCGLALDSEKEEEYVQINKDQQKEEQAENVSFHPGQEIVLEMGEKKLVLSAFLVYVLPLLTMFSGYFLLETLYGTELWGVLGSGLGLGLGFLVIRFINNRLVDEDEFSPRIKNIISRKKGVDNIE